MRRRIGQYRRQPINADEDPEIGCLLLRDVTFFEPGYEAQPPPEFASNIVQGRSYDLSQPEYAGRDTLRIASAASGERHVSHREA